MKNVLRFSESTSPNQNSYSHVLFIHSSRNESLSIFYHFYKILLKDSMNPSLLRKTANIQLRSKDPMYPFEQQKTMDIQFQSKDSMYPLDKTYRISNVSTIL
jgi:hypothetical protein